ncbi:unnamed protein product [Brassica rapa subsp. narinosa]
MKIGKSPEEKLTRRKEGEGLRIPSRELFFFVSESNQCGRERKERKKKKERWHGEETYRSLSKSSGFSSVSLPQLALPPGFSPIFDQTKICEIGEFNRPFLGFRLTFVEKNYKDLKTLNPKFPFLIRECSGIQPQMWARYDMGVERCVNLDGMNESQILKSLEDLVKAGGATKA